MRPVRKIIPTEFFDVTGKKTPGYEYFGDFEKKIQKFELFTNDKNNQKHYVDIELGTALMCVHNWRILGQNPFGIQLNDTNKISANIKTIENKFTDLYRESKPHLVHQLGSYCSFCEMRINYRSLDIEHRLPKSVYPQKYVSWENFLLACKDCNTIKSNNPSRAVAKSWFPNLNLNEEQICNAIERHYVWPNKPEGDSYRRFQYKLDYAFGIIPMDEAFQNDSAFNSSQDNVWVTIQIEPDKYENCKINIIPFETLDGAEYKSKDTLDLLGLKDRTASRTEARTKAWFDALRHVINDIKILDFVTDPVNKSHAFQLTWKNFIILAKSLGFYSTIVTLLNSIPDPLPLDPATQEPLSLRFIRDTDPERMNAETSLIFPGTVVTNIP